MPDSEPSIADRNTILSSRIAALLIVTGALLSLVGWAFESEILKAGLPGLVPMNPTTALLFIASAVSLGLATLRARLSIPQWSRWLLALTIVIASLIVLVRYVVGWGPGIDSVLFTDSLHGNRMAPNTALYFGLIGMALLLIDIQPKRGPAPAPIFAILVLVGSVTSVLGYLFGARGLYGIGAYIPIAINTAALLAVLSFGILCARSDRGAFSLLRGSGMGSKMARRLLPTALGIKVALGTVRLWGERAGWYDKELGVALMVVAGCVTLAAAILITARMLNCIDLERAAGARVLRDREEQYRFLAESMPDMIWRARARGGLDYVNERWLEYTGLPLEEIRGRGWRMILHPDDVRQCIRRCRIAVKNGVCFEFESRFRRCSDGTYRWHLVRGTPRRNSQGEIVQWVGHCADIDDQKRLAQELNEQLERRVLERTNELAVVNEDLRQKNQENEMFVYSVSHDLRSPLVNLQGFSKELSLVAGEIQTLVSADAVPETIRNRMNKLLTGDLRESIHFIETGVMRLSNIIDALLRLSRAGRIEYQFRTLDMHTLVGSIVASMSATILEKQADVVIHPLSECDGDATAVEQIFINLLGNALKYLDPDRPVAIEVGEVRTKDNRRVFYVKDNGLGIPDTCQGKLFQAFKRFHRHVASGDGMGLAIVRRIVERHGGEIRCESEEGKGTTFFVSLPFRNSAGDVFTSYHEPQEGEHDANRTDDRVACRGR